jgi:LPPG:FO 2-phospho-L-lactate transferase
MIGDRVVVLTGGVGGAKLVLGLTNVMAPADVTAIVNVGDDFRHLGLHVSPDADTLLYTLAGLADPQQGWGRADESWAFMESLAALGGPDWFRLGDRDLAIHLLRTHRLDKGERLSTILSELASAMHVAARLLPASDDPVATWLDTDEGRLPFQEYFVHRRAAPVVSRVSFVGADTADPAPGVIESLLDPRARAILIAPSNPFLSIEPILAVPAIRDALARRSAPAIAVSPIIAGKAIKGPTAKLMHELGIEVTPAAVAARYAGLIDGLLLDERDVLPDLPIAMAQADTLMHDLADKQRVARACLALADRLRR